MTWRKATLLVVLVVLVGVILYDVAAAMGGGYEATISYLVLGAATVRAVIALAVGVLLGHLFWPVPRESSRLDLALVAGGLVALAIAGVLYALHVVVPPVVALVGGLPLGRLLWGQPARDPESP